MFREASELDTESVTFKQKDCLEVEIEELSFFFFPEKLSSLLNLSISRFWWLALLCFILSLARICCHCIKGCKFFSCKEPYNKYFQLCGIYSLC